MRRLATIIILTTALTLTFGCGPVATGQPDDLTYGPGGFTYKANFQQQGVRNPWPPIISKDVVLADNITISYRAEIETRAGEIRNNIVAARKAGGGHENPELNLSVSNVPAGIEVKEGEEGGGLPGTVKHLLIIEISKDVKPGEYTFDIGIEFNGKDYGKIPCTIKVVKS
ncbi:MAG: hypothetical protein Q8O55_04360 [Dehalococcoidales bacterium]|nr:hypothetical protein [Dehalococcoidales bacterium]